MYYSINDTVFQQFPQHVIRWRSKRCTAIMNQIMSEESGGSTLMRGGSFWLNLLLEGWSRQCVTYHLDYTGVEISINLSQKILLICRESLNKSIMIDINISCKYNKNLKLKESANYYVKKRNIRGTHIVYG